MCCYLKVQFQGQTVKWSMTVKRRFSLFFFFCEELLYQISLKSDKRFACWYQVTEGLTWSPYQVFFTLHFNKVWPVKLPEFTIRLPIPSHSLCPLQFPQMFSLSAINNGISRCYLACRPVFHCVLQPSNSWKKNSFFLGDATAALSAHLRTKSNNYTVCTLLLCFHSYISYLTSSLVSGRSLRNTKINSLSGKMSFSVLATKNQWLNCLLVSVKFGYKYSS